MIEGGKGSVMCQPSIRLSCGARSFEEGFTFLFAGWGIGRDMRAVSELMVGCFMVRRGGAE